MIPAPKLDDRTFDDLVAEALALIPRYAPEWTSRNPADPGVTLVELAAWMTHQLIERLNQVPERNYVAFLDLLGVALRPPRAATAVVRFSLVDGAVAQCVPGGTQVSTPPASQERVVTFETAQDVVVAAARPDRCVSACDGGFADNSRFVDPVASVDGDGFDAFAGLREAERYLYLSDPRLASCGEGAILRVELVAPDRDGHRGRDLARMLDWACWDGTRWRELTPAAVDVDRGEVAFAGPLAVAPLAVHHVTGPWLRGRLVELPESPADTELVAIRARVDVLGDGTPPSRALANLDTGAFVPLDLGKHVYPFGKEPRVDCVLYLAVDDACTQPDTRIALAFELADPVAIAAPAPSEQLVLAYERWDGRRWRCFGRSTPRGVLPGDGEDVGFHDDTAALSRSGTVEFRRPRELATSELCGVTARWLRVRIETGDYGTPGSYALDGERWLFRDPRPLRPPALRGIAVRARGAERPIAHVLAFADFAFVDLGSLGGLAAGDRDPVQPFVARGDASPAMYLGYPTCPPREPIGLYIAVESAGLEDRDAGEPQSGHRIAWEYATADGWRTLAVVDETAGLAANGFVWFVPPDDWRRTPRFGDDRLWLRARLAEGGYASPPRVRLIASNAIDAHHHDTIRDELLGSSDGAPLQQFRLLRGPLLEDEVLEVRERRRPPAAALSDLGRDAVRGATDELDGEVWVRYRRVDNLFASGPDGRHYTLDHATGTIAFGDGRRGFVPPALPHNIVATRYRIGGGAAGNVGAHTLTSLGRALAYIAAVTNPLPAGGGADRETIDEAKARAPEAVRNRDRAVTADDYEALALRASTALARARCVPDPSGRTGVTVVVVPRMDPRDADLTRRLVPSPEVLRSVARYLDDRRLIGTTLAVVRPRYRDLAVRVVLAQPAVTEQLDHDIAAALRRHLHPLIGGRTGSGWEFGRAVVVAELVRVVEQLDGVASAVAIELRDDGRTAATTQVRLATDELPFVARVDVVGRGAGDEELR